MLRLICDTIMRLYKGTTVYGRGYMKRIVHNFLICLTHFICVVFIESILAVTIIWFSDYGYSLNGILILCAALVFGAHYFTLRFHQKRRTLSRKTIYTLLCLDSAVCLLSVFLWIGVQIYLHSMPLGQIVFAVTLNCIMLLLRIVVTVYLRGLLSIHKRRNS